MSSARFNFILKRGYVLAIVLIIYSFHRPARTQLHGLEGDSYQLHLTAEELRHRHQEGADSGVDVEGEVQSQELGDVECREPPEGVQGERRPALVEE